MFILLEIFVITVVLYVFIAYVIPFFFPRIALSEKIEEKKEELSMLKRQFRIVNIDAELRDEAIRLNQQIASLTEELKELEKEGETN
jgi:Tfp pilus assembly protein PilO